jgi:hypothetical protein
MESLLEVLKLYGAPLSAIGASLAFIFGVYKFQAERQTALFWKEFEVYHKLVKELVEPPSESGAMYIDRQAAIMLKCLTSSGTIRIRFACSKGFARNGL